MAALLGRGEVEPNHLLLVGLRELPPVDGGRLGERSAESENLLIRLGEVDFDAELGGWVLHGLELKGGHVFEQVGVSI